MKNVGNILVLLFISFSMFCQNLVPNPGFEEYTLCPDDHDQLNVVENWNKLSNAEGTPDYYNRCFVNNSSAPNMGIPVNWDGFQETKSGDAYTGVYTYGYQDVREYIQVELIEPLVANNYYKFTMYVNTANRSGVAIDAFGVYISEELITGEGNYLPLNVVPQISNPLNEIMIDTANWTLIRGFYLANGEERFLTIGNFLSDSLTTTELFDAGGGAIQGYTYIDDVSLIQVDSIYSGLSTATEMIKPKVYPNPLNDQFNIELNDYYTGSNSIRVFKILGNSVLTKKVHNSRRIELDISDLNQGIYIYQITDNKNVIFTGKFIKN